MTALSNEEPHCVHDSLRAGCITRKERSEHKTGLCKDNGEQDGIGRLAMLCNDGAQVLVEV